MRILDLYIGKAVIGGAFLVMCVLLSLFAFIEFIGELDVIGRADYGVWEACRYVLLSVPRLTYELMPMAALIGSLIGLGVLAGNHELVIMRASGVSLARISWAAIKAGLLLVVFAVWVGEWVVADAEQSAATLRSSALAGNDSLRTGDGFWTRDGRDFINVRTVLPDGGLLDVRIYEFDAAHALERVSRAKSASYAGGEWRLRQVSRSVIGPDGVSTEHLPELTWRSQLKPDLLDIIAIKPNSLSVSGLYRYIRYLRANGLSSGRYELEFWTKIALPFATCVMVFAALPFVFGPLRSVGVGQRMLIGVLVGIGFYLFNQTVSYIGLVYEFNPVVSAVLPTVLLLAGAVYMMRRIH
ncbi:MAG: LPS export ABC transporter permease LptG [Gammaproteobacteria bacterium]|nr:LPS export ABC transporter permease LptG [Gammaproteobacteria bacterium]